VGTLSANRDEGGAGRLALFGWMTGSAFFFYAWVLRVSPSVMVDELMRDFVVGGAILGNLSAFYFYAYAGLQVPMGVLLDRFGPRRLMTVAALVCGGGAVLFAATEVLALTYLGRLLIGGGAACSFVAALSIAARWFPPRRFALLAGISQALGMAGGVAGQAPVGFLVDTVGWRPASMGLAIFGLAIALAAWHLVPRRQSADRASAGDGTLLAGLRIAAANPQTWLAALVGLASAAPLLGFAALWGVPYLEKAYGLEREVAASLTSLLFAGWGIGAPLIGWLSDRLGRRKPPMITGILIALTGMSVLLYWPGLSVTAVAVLCFIIGMAGSAQLLCFALTRESNPTWGAGAALGIVNTMVTGGGALFQPAIGFALDLAWSGETASGVPVYAVADYIAALSIMVAAGGVGLLATLALKETFCRQREG
jgi:MFS family permease